MPFIVSFTHPVVVTDEDLYINECCIGGDVVVDQLLPELRARYGEVQSNQEDWGWFAWFSTGTVRLAVDVHTEDPTAGAFQVHLTSRVPRRLFGDRVDDTPELDALRELVIARLGVWGASNVTVERVDDKYMPI